MAERQRSPRAPSIDLQTALERAKQFYAAEKGNAAPVDSALGHWGYKGRSGTALTTLASLKQYGILIDEGAGSKRMVRLSPSALQIIRDPREVSAERDLAIREAALTPKIHRQVWDEHPEGLPSDETLQWHLLNKHGFTDSGAREFVGQFRRTIAFAKLDESSPVEEDAGYEERYPDRPSSDVSQPPGGVTPRRDPREPFVTGGVNTLIGPPADYKSYRIPVGGEDVIVTFEGPVDAEKWETFMTILNAMKEPILKERSQPPPEEHTGYQD